MIGFCVILISLRRFSSAELENWAPNDGLLVRAFLGDAAARKYTEPELLAHARRELADILGPEAEPRLVHISRRIRALPSYDVGHEERIAIAEQRAAAIDGLILAGAAFRGVGVPDCISSAETAARIAFNAVCPD